MTESPTPRRRKRCWYFGSRLCVLGALPCLLSLGGAYDHRLELFTHFQPLYLLALVPALGLLLAARQWVWAAGCSVFALPLLVMVAPWYVPAGEVQGGVVERFTILQANILTSNTNYEAFTDYVLQTHPHVISVQEINEAWADALQPLFPHYPHRHFVPRSDNFGIGILSKLPLNTLQVQEPGDVPAITTSVEVRGRRIGLLLIHTLPPAGRIFSETRNSQLMLVNQWASTQQQAVVIGDLNCTMWSPWYDNMIEGTGLRDSRRGFGILGSWPAYYPLRIPIDHFLIKGELSVQNLNLGPGIGSDHLPLLVEIALHAVPINETS